MAKLPKKPRPGDLARMFEELVGAPMSEWRDPDAVEEDFDPVGDLIDLFNTTGAMLVSPPILQPASVFLDTAGEDIRRRLFVTTGADGEELCLRPEFTIPVCLEYLSGDVGGLPATFAYMGPVFRQRPGELGEFQQAGIERFGEADRTAADAETIGLAFDAIGCFGLVDPEVRIGDEGLFSALLDALELPAAVRRRLRAAFGDAERLEATLAALVARDTSDIVSHAGFLGAIAGTNHDAARAVVEDLLAIAGIKAVGGRSAHEIAERFLEQAALKAEGGLSAEKARIIRGFLAISGPPEAAAKALDTFAKASKVDMTDAIGTFKARNREMAARGIQLDTLTFAAGFGRNLDYYTGFVFEMLDPDGEDGKPVLGGGRYDTLLERLGADAPIPAIGFSMWLDRLALDIDLDLDLDDLEDDT